MILQGKYLLLTYSLIIVLKNMKDYLIKTFEYNTWANKEQLQKIALLPDNTACVKLFSHLINCQHKWLARITHHPSATTLSWWEPEYPLQELANEWDNCIQPWYAYLQTRTEEELVTEVIFTGFDGGKWAATPMDIALQLNYHSIHHRAQMQTIIRQQGLEPDFLDYIGKKYRKLS
jgi:uncharacterized damage-inducible protein DinB